MKISEGLILKEEKKTINGELFTLRTLIAEDGYCFYSADEDAEIPTYFKVAHLGLGLSKLSYDELAKKFVCILEKDKKIMMEEENVELN
mgnify:CR=1 FL=1